MQQMAEMGEIGFSPSFNCYSSDSLTSAAAAKVSREVKEEQAAILEEFSDADDGDFEFSLKYAGEEFSSKELALAGRFLFPIFNSDLVTKDEVDHDHDHDSSLIIPLEKLFLGDSDDSISSASSETEESDDKVLPSGTFCVSWRKADVGLPNLSDCKKSRSTGSESGSGSRKWKMKEILRRSNSAGKETVFFFCPKKVAAASKQTRIVNSSKVPKLAGKSKTSVHELFYVQRRAEQKGDKMKSYLPYRQDLLGFFVNVNGNGNKKLPF